MHMLMKSYSYDAESVKLIFMLFFLQVIENSMTALTKWTTLPFIQPSRRGKFEFVHQLRSSPDSDYNALLKMMMELSGGHFESEDGIIVAVDRFLEVQDDDFN